MIREISGNILTADTQALVNTVNTVGVMGKGIALQFKQAFPENYQSYQAACAENRVRTGEMFVYETGALGNPSHIVNFPTKAHWRSRSKLADIDRGLMDLVNVIREYEITSIAIPALGCGNGGLSWSVVRPRIYEAFSEVPDVAVLLYPPQDAPAAQDMPVGTAAPSMNRGRVALLELMRRYMRAVEVETFVRPVGVSLLELQKLTYFLQLSGEMQGLKFRAARYGPYAENLNTVLQHLEGHYVRGYGDRSEQILKLQPIELLPGAVEYARRWIDASAPDLEKKFSDLDDLITGFASPYGVELLSTVHWVATHGTDERPPSEDEVVARVQEWSERKKELFTRKHVLAARKCLVGKGWLKD